jgi:hypothetical protein
MLVRSAFILAFALPALVSGKIPLMDGVIRGFRSADASEVNTLKGSESVTANAPARTLGKLRVVENSGICGRCILFVGAVITVAFTVSAETTPNVYQASGYGDLTANESIWFVLHHEGPLYDSYEHFTDRFWFFAARNSPESAPLITWFNGGVSDVDRPSILGCSVNYISPEAPAWLGCFRNLDPASSTTRVPELI